MTSDWFQLVAAVSYLDQVDLQKVAFGPEAKEKAMKCFTELKSKEECEAICMSLDIIESFRVS